jgi:DNA repair protein RadC
MPSLQRRVLEQAQQYGIEQLSDADLLALILAKGTVSERVKVLERVRALLAEHGGLGNLLRSGFPDHEFDTVLATRLHALLELSRRLARPAGARAQIESADDAAALVRMELMFLDHEEMHLLLLDSSSHVVGYIKSYKGTVNSSVLRAAEIFRPAIVRNCPRVIVCHNHPSGNPEPSLEDIAVTEQLVQAGKVLDIELLDHLVLGNPGYISLRERLHW